ncbi:MAG: diacylglycerol kinase [Bacteroidetes bacterium 4484_276]|nr:MAG: diacylglycerol kinase [Bacteroidetes bacterium 4484_276]
MSNPEKNKHNPIYSTLLSFKYAFNGIYLLLATQRNARIHLAATVLVVFVGFYFSISVTEWVAVIIAIGIVFAAEAFNTAIEQLVDMVSPEFNKPAGRIKDVAAGAVLITAIAAAMVGIIIFGPKFFL